MLHGVSGGWVCVAGGEVKYIAQGLVFVPFYAGGAWLTGLDGSDWHVWIFAILVMTGSHLADLAKKACEP